MELDESGDVDVSDAVAIGEAEFAFTFEMLGNAPQPTAGHRLVTGIDQRHCPRVGLAIMDGHLVRGHVDRHIGHVKEVIGEIFLDYITLIPTADHEIRDAMMRIELHYMPQDRTNADLDHGLRTATRFFHQACAQAACQDDRFSNHLVPFWCQDRLQGSPLSNHKLPCALKVRDDRNAIDARRLAWVSTPRKRGNRLDHEPAVAAWHDALRSSRRSATNDYVR